MNHLSQLSQWLTMGKYSIFVWSAYGLAIVIFLFNFIGLRGYKKRVKQRLARKFRGQP